MLRPTLVLAGLAASLAVLSLDPRSTEHSSSTDAPVLVPFAVDGARELLVTDAAIHITNVSEGAGPLTIDELTIRSNGATLYSEVVGAELAEDRRYVELQILIERMPTELTHREGERRFAPEAAPEIPVAGIAETWSEIERLSRELRLDYASGRPQPFVELHFPLPLDQVFYPEDLPGTTRAVTLTVRWSRGGDTTGTTEASLELQRLRPLARSPQMLSQSLGSFTVHAGDLHVHSCHGEASNACAPSGDCAAESFQTSGSFSYAQLKTQYQALGLDWFTATDHSYCINSDAEYQSIVNELAAITDGSFLAPPGIELSSEEEGAQQGSDLADILCLLGPNQNHMGAHGITSRKEGGDDGFLGFCNGLFSDALEPFSPNAASVRADGGYPIVNHPDGSSFAWNSFDALDGIEADSMHGVEIWNGATQSGQGGGVASWVQWLLGGRILYAYSGSDTHDAAFAFGANNAVFLDEPFTVPNLQAILKKGRVFISNGHVLVLEIDLDGTEILMGQLQSLAPTQPASSLSIDVHYDFGPDTSTISVFRGEVGAGAETAVCTSGPLSGQGVFTCSDTLDPGVRSWYRAYSDANAGAITAYTNPVFFLPSSVGSTTYGTGLGGANIATLSSPSSPAIGSLFTFELSAFSPASSMGVLALSRLQIPSGVPLAGGFLLVSPPFELLAAVPLSGGSGTHSEEIPFDAGFVGMSFYAQSVAVDASQASNLAFSNGVALTIADILQ